MIAAQSRTPEALTVRRDRWGHAALLLVAALAATAPVLPASAQGVLLGARGRENVAIERLEFLNSNGSLVLQGLSLTGSSLPRAEVEGILRAGSAAGLGERIARLDAERLTVARIEWRLKTDLQETLTVYEDLEGRTIKAGIVDELVVRSATQTAATKSAPDAKPIDLSLKLGRMSIATLDLAGIFRWYSEADPTGNAPMKTLYGRYELDGMEGKAEQFSFNVGRTVGSGMKLRLMREPALNMIRTFEAAASQPKNKGGEIAILAAIADMYGSFEFGDASIDGMRFAGKDAKSGQDITGRLGKMVMQGGARPSGTLSDLDIVASDGHFRVARFGAEGDFYGTMLYLVLKGMEMETAKLATPEAQAALQKTQPVLAGLKASDFAFRLEGLDVDVPPGRGAKSPERVRLRLDRFEAATGGFIGMVPTKLDYTLSRFSMPLPNDPSDSGLKTLRDLGIDLLDISARLKASWEEARQRLHIEEVTGDLGKFGRVSLKGELAGIPRTVLENPLVNWPMLMGSGNVQNVGIALQSSGGVEKLIAMTAREQRKTPEQMTLELSGLAPILIGSLMQNHPDATAVADAVTRFVRAPGMLSLTARAATPAGLTLPDFLAASGNPAAILPKIRVEAVAR